MDDLRKNYKFWLELYSSRLWVPGPRSIHRTFVCNLGRSIAMLQSKKLRMQGKEHRMLLLAWVSPESDANLGRGCFAEFLTTTLACWHIYIYIYGQRKVFVHSDVSQYSFADEHPSHIFREEYQNSDIIFSMSMGERAKRTLTQSERYTHRRSKQHNGE